MTQEASAAERNAKLFIEKSNELGTNVYAYVRLGQQYVPDTSELVRLVGLTVGTPCSRIFVLENIANQDLNPDSVIQGRIPFYSLPDSVGINLTNSDYGLFEIKSAQRFEAKTIFKNLTAFKASSADPNEYQALLKFYQDWIEEYRTHYGLDYNEPLNLEAAFTSKFEYKFFQDIANTLPNQDFKF